jgi:hypothetical protein
MPHFVRIARRGRVPASLVGVLAFVVALFATAATAGAGTTTTPPQYGQQPQHQPKPKPHPQPHSKPQPCPPGTTPVYGKCVPEQQPPPDQPPVIPPPAAPPAGTPPAPAPPQTAAPVTTPAPAPTNVVAGHQARSATASLRTPTRCSTTTFRVTVRGRSLRTVTFSVAGRRIRTVTVPSGRRTVSVNLPVRRFGARRQSVAARVTFRNGARSRTLTASATRCAQGAVSPQFTG